MHHADPRLIALTAIVALLLGRPAVGAEAPAPTVRADADGAWATSAVKGEGLVSYLFDWGDGSVSLGSPVYAGAPCRGTHRWARKGAYPVRSRCISQEGTLSGWSTPQPVQVVQAAAPWRPVRYRRIDKPGSPSILLDLGSHRRFDQVELVPMPGSAGLSKEMRLEYSTDGGSAWYTVPRYTAARHPGPAGSRVLLETGPLCASRVRITGAGSLRRITLRAAGEPRFFTSLGRERDADLNNLWSITGLAAGEVTPRGDAWWDGPGGALAFGSTEWHEWDAMKLAWTGMQPEIERITAEIRDMPMDPDGYVWACSAGPLHLNLQKHFDYNAIHILGAARLAMWGDPAAFLKTPLPDPVRQRCGPGVATMLDRLRKEMEWQLGPMHGSEGLLRVTDPDYDGTPGSKGATYWDAHPTGGTSAYPNALFYASVRAMAALERVAGDTDRARKLEELLPVIRRRFNDLFWQPGPGRYSSTVDSQGNSHDYGITCTNLYAITYGLADPDRALRVMEWISGRRTVAGDRSQGDDIYHWTIAPRANTVAFESIKPSWWSGGFAGVYLEPGQWGEWGRNIQNGGAIFYTSYYDILARIQTLGPDDALARLQAILDEFHKRQLRPERSGEYAPAGYPPLAVGAWTCFPESGLVPLALMYGFMGIDAAADGLHVHPRLPVGMAFAGVRDLRFRGATWTITARRGAKRAATHRTGPDRYTVVVPDGIETVLRPPN